MCTRYAEDLARCRHGSKVLLEVISTFFPANLMHKLVLLLSGQEVVNMGDDEDDEENGAESESDEDEDSGSEEEVEEGDEEDNDEEEDNKDDDEEDEMEVVPAEDDVEKGNFNDGDDDEELVRSRGKQVGSRAEKKETPLLALEEDMVAQKLLRKVLELQAQAEAKGADTEGVAAEWDQVPAGQQDDSLSFYPFASQLSEALQEAELLSSWVTRNRSAFLLSDLAAVPSARVALLGALKDKELSSLLKKGAKEHAGAKSLLEAIKPSSSKKK